MSKGYKQCVQEGWDLFHRGALDELLINLHDTASRLIYQSDIGPLPLGMEEIDFLIEACGVKIAAQYRGKTYPKSSGELVIATTLYAEGGHTALIGDLVAACPEDTVKLCFPHPLDDENPVPPGALERTGLCSSKVMKIPGNSPSERILAAIEACLVQPPARIHLFQHMHDVEAVAVAVAVASITNAKIYMFHHADYSPTVGLYLKKARVIELTERTAAFTRFNLGLSNQYLPLTCPDPGWRRKTFLRNGAVTTGMAVSAAKLFRRGLSGYGYLGVIIGLLKNTKGIHVHIGELPADLLATIHSELLAAGVRKDRFQAVGRCESVAKIIEERGVDVMLNSFPLPGARTSVECMAAGVPMIWHGRYSQNNIRRSRMAYPTALTWFHPDDLLEIIRNIDVDWCRNQGTMARKHWEKTHAPHLWQRFFQDPDHFEIELDEELSTELVTIWHSTFQHNQLLERALEGDSGEIHRLKMEIIALKKKLSQGSLAQQKNRFPLLSRMVRALRKYFRSRKSY
ncbi:MAG: hypothetical protein LAT55_05965 [Opitutales bacterium]|nr:hypothetical protein [Opitutales bacterium]